MEGDQPPDLREMRRNVRENADVQLHLSKMERELRDLFHDLKETTALNHQEIRAEVSGVKDHLRTLNGRTKRMEDWTETHDDKHNLAALKAAKADGIVEGKSQAIFTRGQLATVTAVAALGAAVASFLPLIVEFVS